MKLLDGVGELRCSSGCHPQWPINTFRCSRKHLRVDSNLLKAMQMNVCLISIIGNIKPDFLCLKLSICQALLTKGASFPPRGVLPPAPPGSPTFSQPHRTAVALFIHIQVPLSGSSVLGGRRESLLPSPLKLCCWEGGRGNKILLSFDQTLVQEGQLGPDIGAPVSGAGKSRSALFTQSIGGAG